MSNSVASLPNESPGQWLTRQIERRGMSVRRFADELGVTTQTVYAWQNDRTVISEERVPRLAEALGVPEIEARRGLGYWVPDGQAPPPAIDREDLLKIRAELLGILERLDKLQDPGSGG